MSGGPQASEAPSELSTKLESHAGRLVVEWVTTSKSQLRASGHFVHAVLLSSSMYSERSKVNKLVASPLLTGFLSITYCLLLTKLKPRTGRLVVG